MEKRTGSSPILLDKIKSWGWFECLKMCSTIVWSVITDSLIGLLNVLILQIVFNNSMINDHRYDKRIVECMICPINNSPGIYCYKLHYSYLSYWCTLEFSHSMDELGILPEFQNTMAYVTQLGLIGGIIM